MSLNALSGDCPGDLHRALLWGMIPTTTLGPFEGADPMRTEPEKTRPVSEVRVGAIKAAIWRNETEGGPRNRHTFERIYKDSETWKSSGSFGRDDLLLLAKVSDLAHSKICDLKAEE